MNLFDMRTLAFTSALTEIVCLYVVVILWRQNRNRFDGTVFLVSNFGLQAIGLLMIILRGIIPDWMSFVLANTMIIAGAILGYMGLERFVGKKGPQVHNYVLIILFTIVHAFFTFIHPDLAARNLNFSAALLIVCFQCMWLMLYRVEPAMRALTRGVGVVFGMFSLVNITRMAEFFTGSQVKPDYFRSGTFNALVLISYQVLFILLTYCLVLMFNRRLLADIRTQEEKFSRAFHSSPSAMSITRLRDGKIMDVNESFEKISGYTASEARGETTSGLHLWADDQDRVRVVHDLLRGREVHERELHFRNKLGETVVGLFSADIIFVSRERCVLSSIIDITLRHKAQRDLLKSEALFRAVMDNLPIGIAVNSVDPEVVFSYMNDNFLRFYRTTREALAEPDGFWNSVYEAPVFREAIRKRVLEDCTGEDPGRMHWENVPIARTGEETTYITARNIPIPEERLMISTVWDVTEQRHAEETITRLNSSLELQVAERTKDLRDTQMALLNLVDDLNRNMEKLSESNKALEEANKELEAFSYSVSHDLRAPLRAISGFTRILMEEYGSRLDSEGQRITRVIQDSTYKLGLLIDDLLTFSRMGRLEMRFSRMDMTGMVNSVYHEVVPEEKRGKINFAMNPLPPAWGDSSLMRQVWFNLLSNAVKFSSKNASPRLEVGSRAEGDQDVYWIKDNGVGFDMRYVHKLFGVFQRLHKSDEFEGTGVGLALVQRIVKRHGGRVWAEGEVGQGATFSFSLPLKGKAGQEERHG